MNLKNDNLQKFWKIVKLQKLKKKLFNITTFEFKKIYNLQKFWKIRKNINLQKFKIKMKIFTNIKNILKLQKLG